MPVHIPQNLHPVQIPLNLMARHFCVGKWAKLYECKACTHILILKCLVGLGQVLRNHHLGIPFSVKVNISEMGPWPYKSINQQKDKYSNWRQEYAMPLPHCHELNTDYRVDVEKDACDPYFKLPTVLLLLELLDDGRDGLAQSMFTSKHFGLKKCKADKGCLINMGFDLGLLDTWDLSSLQRGLFI